VQVSVEVGVWVSVWVSVQVGVWVSVWVSVRVSMRVSVWVNLQVSVCVYAQCDTKTFMLQIAVSRRPMAKLKIKN
jgi:hypothetical protein